EHGAAVQLAGEQSTTRKSELHCEPSLVRQPGYVSGPAYLNTLSNVIMRALANKSIGSPDQIGVSGWTHPITSRLKHAKNVLKNDVAMSAAIIVFIVFALSFIPASFVLFLISERSTNSKQVQFVSGINPILYWIVNHIWNLLNYMVPLTIVISSVCGIQELRVRWCADHRTVPADHDTFRLGDDRSEQGVHLLSCLNCFGLVTTMSVTIVRLIGQQNNDESLLHVAGILKNAFLVLPHFCLGQSLVELNVFYQQGKATQLTGSEPLIQTRWGPRCFSIRPLVFKKIIGGIDIHDSAWSASGRYLACLVAHSVVYFALVLLLEYNCCCKQGLVSSRFFRLFYRAASTSARCGSRKQRRSTMTCSLKLPRLTEPAPAPTCSNCSALVKIFSTSSGPRAAVKGISLGVKSQECFGFLGVNGAGKTTTFKMLTGPPRHRRVGIEAHLDKTTQEYSGGNKRKLSCGIAFIGNPPIVFLDEPTAGMDPGARRFLCAAASNAWSLLARFTIFLRVRQPQSQEATSASASASATIDNTEGQLERAHEAFMSAFPDAVLCENHAAVLQYQLKQTVRLRTIFESVQRLKDNGLVLDYSVNQTTLDQAGAAGGSLGVSSALKAAFWRPGDWNEGTRAPSSVAAGSNRGRRAGSLAGRLVAGRRLLAPPALSKSKEHTVVLEPLDALKDGPEPHGLLQLVLQHSRVFSHSMARPEEADMNASVHAGSWLVQEHDRAVADERDAARELALVASAVLLSGLVQRLTSQHLERGRLASSVDAQEAEALLRLHSQTDAFDGGSRSGAGAENLDEPLQFEQVGAGAGSVNLGSFSEHVIVDLRCFRLPQRALVLGAVEEAEEARGHEALLAAAVVLEQQHERK
uniref:ABC transporter domain-containing protein n=1 Tax=Macrostomum lignano TaxID=282301 RepID=A0A1I8F2S2_9PLAT